MTFFSSRLIGRACLPFPAPIAATAVFIAISSPAKTLPFLREPNLPQDTEIMNHMSRMEYAGLIETVIHEHHL